MRKPLRGGWGVRKKTPKMRAFEARIGRPIDAALVEAVNRHGSVVDAAQELGLHYDTMTRWLLARRIDVRVVAQLSEARREEDLAVPAG
jgi:molybdenum-dependent DNA-binding transcriptional regulator ModE